jgi:putative aldouronate transport system substrate-binding protein
MNRKIKMIVAVTTLCLAISVLGTGCKKTVKTETVPTVTANQEPVTIKWLAYQTLGQPDPESAICKAVQKKFNCKFDFMFVDNAKWDEVVNVKLAAGDIPDVMRINNIDNLANYVKQGIAAELPVDTIKKMAPHYASIVEKYDSQKIVYNYTLINGKNYGFTNINVDLLYPGPIIWRTDWLKNVGIDKIPETLAQFEDAMNKFRNNDPDKNGKKDTYGMSATGFNAVYGSVGLTNPQSLAPMVKDGKIVYSTTTNEAKQALTLLAKYYKDGLIDPEYLTGENKGGYWAVSTVFENNRIGVTTLGQWYHYYGALEEGYTPGGAAVEFQKVNPTMQFGPGKPIVGAAGAKSGLPQSNYASEPIMITTQGAKNQRIVDTTLKMLDANYDGDKEYAALNIYGTKDVDYNVSKSGVYNTLITVGSEGRKKGLLVFTFASINPDMKKAFDPLRFKYADENTKYVGLVDPVITNTPAVTEAKTKNLENLKKLTTEAYGQIITGAKPIEYFDEFVKKFNENGGKDLEKALTDSYFAK